MANDGTQTDLTIGTNGNPIYDETTIVVFGKKKITNTRLKLKNYFMDWVYDPIDKQLQSTKSTTITGEVHRVEDLGNGRRGIRMLLGVQDLETTKVYKLDDGAKKNVDIEDNWINMDIVTDEPSTDKQVFLDYILKSGLVITTLNVGEYLVVEYIPVGTVNSVNNNKTLVYETINEIVDSNIKKFVGIDKNNYEIDGMYKNNIQILKSAVKSLQEQILTYPKILYSCTFTVIENSSTSGINLELKVDKLFEKKDDNITRIAYDLEPNALKNNLKYIKLDINSNYEYDITGVSFQSSPKTQSNSYIHKKQARSNPLTSPENTYVDYDQSSFDYGYNNVADKSVWQINLYSFNVDNDRDEWRDNILYSLVVFGNYIVNIDSDITKNIKIEK